MHQMTRDRGALLRVLAVDEREQRVERGRTARRRSAGDRRERRERRRREHIVTPDDAEIRWHLATERRETGEHPMGDDIVEGDRRRRPRRDHGADALAARLVAGAPEFEHREREPRMRGGLHDGSPALLIRPRLGRTREVRDGPVPQSGEQFDRLAHTGRRIDQNPMHARNVAIDQHRGHSLSELADLRIGKARGSEHEAVHLLLEPVDQDSLTRGALVGVAKEYGELRPLGPRLDGPDERREEGVGDVRNDDRDVRRSPCRERASTGIRRVTELCGDPPNAIDVLRPDQLGATESAGGGRL